MPRCTTTSGSNARTNATLRVRSRGLMRWKSARRSRRRGGSTSSPAISATSRFVSSSWATRVPSSPPVPVISSRTRSILFGPQGREQDDISDGGRISQEHDEPIDANSQATGGRQPVFEGTEVVLVDRHRLLVAGGAGGALRLEPCPLDVRVDELAERVAELASRDDALEPLDEARELAVIARE